MKHLLHSLALRVTMLIALLVSFGSSGAWATAYISYLGNTQQASTTITSSNVSSGTVGVISWTGTSCTYSSNRVNIAANGSITFTASSGYNITKIVITSGSSSSYYGTWTSSPSVTPSSSSGVTTFDGLSANSVTVTTSTAFRCTSASDIKIYYQSAASTKDVGAFSVISDQEVTKGGNISFNPASYFTPDEDLTADATLSITPTTGDIYYSDGKIYATNYGSQEFTVTATPAVADADNYDAVETTFTVNCEDTRTATTTAINTSAIKNNVFVGTDGGSVTATVTPEGGVALVTPTISWSSSNPSAATIDETTGVITLVDAGSTTITATYAGDGSYKPSSATFVMTVINEDPSMETVWSEDFSDYSEGNKPSGGTYSYSCTNGGGTTQVYNNNNAGGTKPEILVAKGSGTFSATIPLNGLYTGNMTLSFKSNAYDISVSTTTTGVSISGTSSFNTLGTHNVTFTGITTSTNSLVVTFTGPSGDKNVRLDDIELKGTKATFAITSITFDAPKTASVAVGGTVTLTPTVLPANYTETVDWESDAEGVATVSSTGVVTGVTAGTAHITAKAHDNPTTIYDVCTVTVTAPVAVTGVSLNKNTTTLLLGGTETLTATVAPADATNKNVTWTSDDDTKVSVENGVITALALTNGTPVNITVTTEDGSKMATCAVTVNPVPVSEVSLDKTEATLRIGKTLTLTETVDPDNATVKTVTWESDDEDIATVEDGVVTAVAVGTATITVKSNADNTKSATCEITVTDGSIELAPGDVITFDDFSGAGTGGYKTQNCDLEASDGNLYEWSEVNAYSNGGWQLKASTGDVTSPAIKTTYGFIITATMSTNSVVISDGTNEGTNTLTTSKTNTTITISSTSSYAKISSITITALKQPVATDLAITDPGTLATGATGTFAYTKTTEESNTKAWTSNNTSAITITNASTGAYSATGRGTAKITLTLTPTDATNYKSVSAERTVSVTAPVVITASDVSMTYGDAAKAIGATTSTGYAGTLSYSSGNTSIATVDATGKVTAVAAGSTTITISAPADAENLYTAGEDKVINVTVSAPDGKTTADTPDPETIVSNTLQNSSLPSSWTGDGAIWYGSSDYGAVAENGDNGSTYDLKTETIDLDGSYTSAKVSFEHTGKTFSTPSNACKLYVKDGDEETQLTINTYFTGGNWTYVTNNTDLTAYLGKSIQLIFRYTPTSDDAGKWEIRNFKVQATPIPTTSVETTGGIATYCYQYPLNLDGISGAKAYKVSEIDLEKEKVRLTQITGTIKGGVPFILMSDGDDATFDIPLAESSSTVPASNLLVGTLAPTFVEQVVDGNTNFAYSKKNGCFVKINENGNTVPANRAYLPINLDGSSVKAFSLSFDTETGINEIGSESGNTIFNLAGQRVNKAQKGLYIMNGKKVLVK